MLCLQYDFKPVFSLPSPSPQQRNDAIKVAPVADHCDPRTPDRITPAFDRFRNFEIHSPIPTPIHRKPSFISKPLVEASIDDIFGSDGELDDDLDFEADFADDELEDDEEEDEDYDTLDPNSLAHYISAFLDPYVDSDDEYFE